MNSIIEGNLVSLREMDEGILITLSVGGTIQG